MPRQSRIVAPGVAHHVTQRGTDCQKVFYARRDRGVYLDLLRLESERAGLDILAYCLMPNHIHVLCVPEGEESLAICFRRTHGRYAQYLNARRQRSGHLWQNRFYSCPLDDAHLWTALRYIELNPVRAGLVANAEDFPFSSAAAHLSGRDLARILDMEFWKGSGRDRSWAEMLKIEQNEADRKALRKATYAGRPFGSEEFVQRWNRPNAVEKTTQIAPQWKIAGEIY